MLDAPQILPTLRPDSFPEKVSLGSDYRFIQSAGEHATGNRLTITSQQSDFTGGQDIPGDDDAYDSTSDGSHNIYG